MKHVTWLNLILGVWLCVSPVAFGYDVVSTAATRNDVVIGLVIIGCSFCVLSEVRGQPLWNTCGLLCGAWLMLAPFILNYRAYELGNDLAFGASVIVISAIETWRMTHRLTSLA